MSALRRLPPLVVLAWLLPSSPALAAPPVAQDDLLLVAAGSSVVFDYLVANDSDADGDILSVVGTSAPSHGTLEVGAVRARATLGGRSWRRPRRAAPRA